MIGTDEDNTLDAIRHGRINAKLNEDKVREIREEYLPLVRTQRSLGDRHGVAKGTIGRVVRNETWVQVLSHAEAAAQMARYNNPDFDPTVSLGPIDVPLHPPRFIVKLDEESARELRQRYANGETAAALARDYNIAHQTVQKILRGTRWEDPDFTPIPARPPQKLSYEAAEQIRARRAAGERAQDIADSYGVHVVNINAILRGAAYSRRVPTNTQPVSSGAVGPPGATRLVPGECSGRIRPESRGSTWKGEGSPLKRYWPPARQDCEETKRTQVFAGLF
jgi:uncharacterized protein (DUF433 family)